MNGETVGVGYLLGVAGVVASGAVIPVVPTGAVVSVAAALAEQDHLFLIALVLAFGALGAYLGDLGTYAVLRIAGRGLAERSGPLARWLQKQRRGTVLQRVQQQLDEHEKRTLLLSRLVPGGQIPVLVAASVDGYPWRRYAVADTGAVTLWSAMYTMTGLLGRAVFPRTWEGVAAGIGLVLLLSAFSALWTRRRSRRTDPRPARS